MDSPCFNPAAAPAAATRPSPLAPVLMDSGAPEQLMLAYAAGDIQAFDRLYEQYRGPLYRFILRQVKDPVASNDLYQQCWEKVIKGRHSYRSKAPFTAWLFRIARNTVVDHFRRQSPAEQAETWTGGDALTGLAAEVLNPESAVLAAEEQGRLAAAIDALPPEQREVVLLRLEAGLDLGAIAGITDCKPETCKSRLRYALAKLQQQLQPPARAAAGGQHATL